MDPYDVREMNALKENAAIERRTTDTALAVLAEDQHKSKLRAKITYVVGGILAFLGTAASFLGGVDWSVLFRPETAALAGASVIFVRALVAFIQRPKT